MINNSIIITFEGNYLRLHYNSKYAAGSCPINSIDDLIHQIEQTCGVGSYCFYRRPKDPAGYAYTIEHDEYKNYPNLPRLTYWQQGVKTGVIEQARDVAKQLWGDIPELEIGWLENKLKTFVD